MTAASARDGMAVGRAARGDIAALALICARGLTILSVVLLFCVSSMLLQHVGYNYETPGGSPLEKMHPGTLVAALAALALLASRARPFAFIAEILARHLGMAAFVCVWCVLLAYLLLVQKSPFTAIIDTFLLPVIMFVLIGAQRAQLERPLEIFLHAFLAVNCLLGLFEVASGWRLVPYVANGVPILDDWRATAILGHPLANASITGCYLLVLMLGGGERLRGAPRAAMLCLTVAAMVAFGGRAATALLFLFAGPVAFIRFLTAIAYGRATAFRAALIAFAVFAAPILLMVLAEAGAFDQFISRFIDDRGSAQARVAMFDLFDYLSWRDILIGPDPALIDTLKQIEGLEFGIESFWVSSILAYGLIMAGIVYVSLFLFCRDLARATRPAAWMLLGYFFAVASTSVSLSAKSAILAIVVILAMVLLPPRRKRAVGA
ncbi:MAG: hypothetical protein BGP06_17830 [Rhizobiales bacterium 65-9]|nr:VpsF family polysaccharide biosynthesis protein [Hyphomicrobiales bacterium]OJY34707.1 MAG: hypothetical protein BGP06_17830 [Rhizobiales bacterium 65-9]